MRCFTYNAAQSQSQTVKYITEGVIMHQYDNRQQTLEWLQGRAVCIRMRWMHKEIHLQKQVSPQETRRSRLSGGSYTTLSPLGLGGYVMCTPSHQQGCWKWFRAGGCWGMGQWCHHNCGTTVQKNNSQFNITELYRKCIARNDKSI